MNKYSNLGKLLDVDICSAKFSLFSILTKDKVCNSVKLQDNNTSKLLIGFSLKSNSISLLKLAFFNALISFILFLLKDKYFNSGKLTFSKTNTLQHSVSHSVGILQA